MKGQFLKFLLIIVAFSCNRKTSIVSNQVDIDLEKGADNAQLFTNFVTFWNYYQEFVKLNEDFLAYDNNGRKISKILFLELLKGGHYFPVVVRPCDSIRYQLKLISPNADADIGTVASRDAEMKHVQYLMEGKPVPKFRFTTLKEKIYTTENINGKILVIKCWFTNCTPCVTEIPDLNRIVTQYKQRKDIIFLSLASDSKSKLKTFLKLKRFDYETVPEQHNYMTNKLNVSSYPLHFIIDRNGNIYKIADNASELKKFLHRLIKKSEVH